MGGVYDVAVHAQMMAQGVAHDPFHHPFRQVRVHHACQRLGQGGIAHNPLDPGPKAEHGFAAGEGGEILQGGRRGVDDVVNQGRNGGFGHDLG